VLICRGVRLQPGIISVKPDADGLLEVLRGASERGRQNEARNREATDQSGRGNSGERQLTLTSVSASMVIEIRLAITILNAGAMAFYNHFCQQVGCQQSAACHQDPYRDALVGHPPS
jgi:hypothetical protein